MIGQLINEFENATDQTLGAFSKVFKTSLKGDDVDSVEILGINTGEVRVIMVGGKKHLVELKEHHQTVVPNMAKCFCYNVTKDGELFATLNTIREVSSYLNTNTSEISRAVRSRMKVLNYYIKKQEVGVKGEQRDPSVVFKKHIGDGVRRKGNAFTVSKDGIGISFFSISDAASYISANCSSITKAVAQKRKVKGYEVSVIRFKQQGESNGSN